MSSICSDLYSFDYHCFETIPVYLHLILSLHVQQRCPFQFAENPVNMTGTPYLATDHFSLPLVSALLFEPGVATKWPALSKRTCESAGTSPMLVKCCTCRILECQTISLTSHNLSFGHQKHAATDDELLCRCFSMNVCRSKRSSRTRQCSLDTQNNTIL